MKIDPRTTPEAGPTEYALRHLYLEHQWTQKKIAGFFRCSPAKICQTMLHYGIQVRGPDRKGSRSPRWKGGKVWGGQDAKYALIYKPEHPQARRGYIYEHRLLMEKKLGRYLLPDEVVHHKDENPKNNHPSNLEVYSNNTAHLAATLRGKCPKWSEDGWRRKQASNRRQAERASTIRSALEIYARRHNVSVCYLTRAFPKAARRLLRMELLRGRFESRPESLLKHASVQPTRPIR